MRRVILIVIVMMASGSAGQEPVKPEQVSLIQLIARPSDFDGKRVRVVGYVTTGLEETAIFVNPQDYENGVLDNSVRLSLALHQEMPLKSNEYAVVEGIFHARTPTHNVRGGIADIDSITRIEPWFLSKKERAAREARARSCWWW